MHELFIASQNEWTNREGAIFIHSDDGRHAEFGLTPDSGHNVIYAFFIRDTTTLQGDLYVLDDYEYGKTLHYLPGMRKGSDYPKPNRHIADQEELYNMFMDALHRFLNGKMNEKLLNET